MAFVVKYLQDIPKNCSECPCSVHVTPNEVYCNAQQIHFEVTDTRPSVCGMVDLSPKEGEMNERKNRNSWNWKCW